MAKFKIILIKPIINDQSLLINDQSSFINDQSSIINDQWHKTQIFQKWNLNCIKIMASWNEKIEEFP